MVKLSEMLPNNVLSVRQRGLCNFRHLLAENGVKKEIWIIYGQGHI